jgi:hypothetical protein
LIIGAISLAMVETLLVHEVVPVISAVRVVDGLVLLGLVSSGERRRNERNTRDCKSEDPYCFQYIEFHLGLPIRTVDDVWNGIGIDCRQRNGAALISVVPAFITPRWLRLLHEREP